jgi:hypothetical protein
MHILEPHNLKELLKLFETRITRCIFRGQSPQDRVLNSTLARELRGQTNKFPANYIPREPLETWTIQNLYVYIRKVIINNFKPHEDILRPLNGKGDPIFEIIRYIQQNPLQPKIINGIANHPTPALEFSESSMIALYFASEKLDHDGAIFCLSKESISTYFSFKKAHQAIARKNEIAPCIIDPLTKLNDGDDPKPKRQQAVYIFQRDLRNPINKYLPIEKIIISKMLYHEIKALLETLGITKKFVYGIPTSDPVSANPNSQVSLT